MGEGGGAPPPHLQISDVSDQVVPDFSIAQETILVNRNSRKLQGASFRDKPGLRRGRETKELLHPRPNSKKPLKHFTAYTPNP